MNSAQTPTEKPKRKRRTKAEIKADLSAAKEVETDKHPEMSKTVPAITQEEENKIRKFDYNKMSPMALAQAGNLIALRVGSIMQEATIAANEYLKLYGLETKIKYSVPYPIGRPDLAKVFDEANRLQQSIEDPENADKK